MEMRSTQPYEILSSNEYIENQNIEYQKTSFLNALERYPADTYLRNMFKVNHKDTRTTPKTNSSVFFANFEHISQLALRLLLLTLNM